MDLEIAFNIPQITWNQMTSDEAQLIGSGFQYHSFHSFANLIVTNRFIAVDVVDEQNEWRKLLFSFGLDIFDYSIDGSGFDEPKDITFKYIITVVNLIRNYHWQWPIRRVDKHEKWLRLVHWDGLFRDRRAALLNKCVVDWVRERTRFQRETIRHLDDNPYSREHLEVGYIGIMGCWIFFESKCCGDSTKDPFVAIFSGAIFNDRNISLEVQNDVERNVHDLKKEQRMGMALFSARSVKCSVSNQWISYSDVTYRHIKLITDVERLNNL